MRPDPLEAALAFGPFRLFPAARRLECQGKPVQIGGRALDILIQLAERAGEVVSKRDLVARVWADVTVDEVSLRVHVTALRKALGDGRLGARYVINVSGRGYSFVAPISRTVEQPPHAHDARPGVPAPLPALLARIIGRDDTLQKITNELSTHRFVTIVGPGGIGKTTVATAAGHALSATFDSQVGFVDLGPLSEPRLVASVIASTLGPTVSSEDPTASLLEFLRDRRVLLILDSCEPVIEALAVLAETILKAAPSVHILATSRESLRVEGEHVLRLLPLQSPEPGEGLRASEVIDFPAAQLFIERATASCGDFALSDSDAPAVGDICRRLDGIPLALELAAARVDAFGIKGLAARLDDRLMLTTRGRRTAIPRHQTLGATLDWSYDRLPRAEQLLLDRLSIFKGAFNFEAVAAVCAGGEVCDTDIPDGFADLVAKSLVTTTFDSVLPSYRLLDTTRSYAGEKLGQNGEREIVAQRHARYVCNLFQLAARQWEERASVEWLATYRPQIDNLRAALTWAFSEGGDPGLGVALTIAAGPLWSQLSLVDESLEWVERALSASANLQEKNPRAEMQLYAALGGLQLYVMSSVRRANSAWEAALTIATELGEADYQLRALRALWAEAINHGEFRRALSLAKRFQGLASQTDDVDDQIVSDRLTGTALHFMGDYEKAHAVIERMLGRYVGSAARSHVVRYQFNQRLSARAVRGRILWVRGRPDSALRDIEENVSEAIALDHTMSLCNVLAQAACPVALLVGELDTAQHYLDVLIDRTGARALDVWRTYALCFGAALDIERGDPEVGLDRLHVAAEKLHRSGFGHNRTSFLLMRTVGLLRLNRATDADAAIDEAMTICERTGEGWSLPELHRMQGEIALNRQGSEDIEAAVEAFEQALRLAREQQALAWELRAATSLVRCLQGDTRMDAARTLLRGIYAQFSEGHDRRDLRAAAALLEPPSQA